MINKKERPILFNAEMVNAILDEHKTQTRRKLKFQPDDHIELNTNSKGENFADGFDTINDLKEHIRLVSESDLEGIDVKKNQWLPSIFMPRWASRIQLEIIDIRIELLNDISEEDAKKEGVFAEGYETGDFDCNGNPIEAGSFALSFRNLWQDINGKKTPWDDNPYVWVVEFKKVTL